MPVRRVVAALACASLVACSSAASSFTPAHSEPARVHAVTAHIVIKFPRHQHARGRAAQRRDPHYISQATDSVLFTLTQVNGAAPPSGFTTSVSVTLGTDCTGTGPYTCSTSWTVPAASDSFTVGAYDGPAGTGNLLSTNTVMKSITTGANTIGVTLDGVPASIAISGVPTNAVVGTAINAAALTVNALDADGYAIVGAYSTPITLSDTDPTGTTTIATSGSDNPPAGELLSSADSATISYTGGAFSSPATIAATSGNATGSAIFLAVTVLHSFSGGTTDGGNPAAGLVAVGNELYGTTLYSGASNDGTVFEIGTSGGNYSLLYNFTGGTTDGRIPLAGMVDVGNELYGTTGGGGASGDGTVFEISTSGSESVLHSFTGATTDGVSPDAGLVAIGNELYGTTQGGGASNEGTVFAISTSGTESILHNFTGGTTDGSNTTAGLVAVGSELYGTTQDGGASGVGTVFAISTSGAESILHSFTGGTTDGSDPIGALVAVGSELYGTTYSGGASGKGTVFEISTSGANYTVLHSFSGGTTDGAYPEASLVAVGNELYGTTYSGGANSGTVFEISTSGGNYTVLHSFRGTDGYYPVAALVAVGNELYGTAYGGGASGIGTVFSLPIP